MNELVFRGSSLDDLRTFLAFVVREAGYPLDIVQNGYEPADCKPTPFIDEGVKGIREWDEVGSFRVINLAKLAAAVNVLHRIQKKPRETSDKDITLARNQCKDFMKEQS